MTTLLDDSYIRYYHPIADSEYTGIHQVIYPITVGPGEEIEVWSDTADIHFIATGFEVNVISDEQEPQRVLAMLEGIQDTTQSLYIAPAGYEAIFKLFISIPQSGAALYSINHKIAVV